MPAFPLGLPALDIYNLFSADEAQNVIVTQMDAGPPKVRRRSTAGRARYSMGHPAYTQADLNTFLTFYRETVAHGALSFDMTDPVSQATKPFRFASPPSYRSSGAGYWAISAELEVLP